MKFSEAMLKGFEKVDGRQYVQKSAIPGYGRYFPEGDDPMRPSSVCAIGAVNLGFGRAAHDSGGCEGSRFIDHWGFNASELSDKGMHWTEIYGMAVAAGL